MHANASMRNNCPMESALYLALCRVCRHSDRGASSTPSGWSTQCVSRSGVSDGRSHEPEQLRGPTFWSSPNSHKDGPRATFSLGGGRMLIGIDVAKSESQDFLNTHCDLTLIEWEVWAVHLLQEQEHT